MIEAELDLLITQKRYQSIAVVGDASAEERMRTWLAHVLHVEKEHPDIIILEGEEGSAVTMDNVRAMIGRLALHPFSGSYYVLIPRAHLLTRACANALLKILEEPERAFFFLLTPHEHALLDTMRSRSVKVVVSLSENTDQIEVLQNDLTGLIAVYNPLSVSEKWQLETATAAAWLELFWRALNMRMLSDFSEHTAISQRAMMIALSDTVMRYIAVNKRGGVVNHKRCVEYCLIAWADIFNRVV